MKFNCWTLFDLQHKIRNDYGVVQVQLLTTNFRTLFFCNEHDSGSKFRLDIVTVGLEDYNCFSAVDDSLKAGNDIQVFFSIFNSESASSFFARPLFVII